MTLSGGPITTLSCDFTSGTGVPDTGTMTGNGVAVDAKIFEIGL
jgi:hypothetical protein